MNGRVVPIGTDVHQQVQAMLPWYVGASLAADDRARVEAHVAECPRCQAELAWEREIHAATQVEASTAADGQGSAGVDQGFALLRQRIAGDPAPPRRRSLLARLKDGWHAGPVWTRWALAGQCVVVVALSGMLLMALVPEAPYRALGGSAAAPGGSGSGNLIVRFRPDTTEQEMRRVLRDNKARLVYGPTTTDAYLLAVPAGLETAAVKQLRKENAVLLVESLDNRGAP